MEHFKEIWVSHKKEDLFIVERPEGLICKFTVDKDQITYTEPPFQSQSEKDQELIKKRISDYIERIVRYEKVDNIITENRQLEEKTRLLASQLSQSNEQIDMYLNTINELTFKINSMEKTVKKPPSEDAIKQVPIINQESEISIQLADSQNKVKMLTKSLENQTEMLNRLMKQNKELINQNNDLKSKVTELQKKENP